jgi:NADH-quinone oxidoreductase subunit G
MGVTSMLHIEIDGKQIDVAEGGTVMDAADALGIYIPRFCYHRKLSVAANCRMCLVDVEKAGKPLPACATPVTDGMKVATKSDKAINAQKGVMEFLLINHPLDCPICDQGGECQLQDLAVGYGGSSSRYTEIKRVVVNKNLGSLIATDMTRCIHCTRCVRFGQEIGGVMELGQAARGEHSEIMPFISQTVDSELSGNMIDLCPVGALTSKPFRYTARTWELSRRVSISPHDGLGANLSVHTMQERVMRVLPRDNEAVNECWLADRDRFSYEALNSEQRLTTPMIKQDGVWRTADWQTALEYVAHGLSDIKTTYGADAIGLLATPHSTLEELYLLQKLARGLGSGNVDHRLRQSDFSADAAQCGAPWLGQSVESLAQSDALLVIGSTLRKDHPLLAHRLRQAVKHGAKLHLLNPVDDDLLCRVAHKAIVAPSAMVNALAQVLKAAAQEKPIELGVAYRDALVNVTPNAAAQAMAQSLAAGQRISIVLGNMAQHHPQAATLHSLALELARVLDARIGFLGEAANSVGAYVAGAWPQGAGMNAAQMLASPRQAYVLLNVEAELDSYDAQQALSAMMSAQMVVALTAFKHLAADYADVMLPIAPFTETSGTFINTEGRVQSFNAVVKPRGETRPAWKVLRVLGNLLNLPGFDYNNTEQVRAELLAAGDVAGKLDNTLSQAVLAESSVQVKGMERIGEVPVYQSDAIVRRAPSLQATQDAQAPRAWVNAALLQQLGVREGDAILLKQGTGQTHLPVARDDRLPDNCVRVAAAHPMTAHLGGLFGAISVKRA